MFKRRVCTENLGDLFIQARSLYFDQLGTVLTQDRAAAHKYVIMRVRFCEKPSQVSLASAGPEQTMFLNDHKAHHGKQL